MSIDQLRDIAPIKATHYCNNGHFYYADGWFLYQFNGFDWTIIDMYTDTSMLNKLWD